MTYAKLATKNEAVYSCEICDYSTSRHYNLKIHFGTQKHRRLEKLAKTSKTSNTISHSCECGNTYKHRQSLYKHRKSCQKLGNALEALEKENSMLREISKLKDEMLALVKSQKIQLTTNFNTTFNNKNEIKIFLSEHCGNALSIQDFVQQLSISLDDLMKTKENTIEGITHIIERNLKPLSLTTRPVHHLEKNEWFLKDQEAWKEDNGNAIVDKTHTKIQKEYLQQSLSEMLDDDSYLWFVKNGTRELEKEDINAIKINIANLCELK